MPRWDVLLVAAAVAGGSVLIERSHRVDAGAPDEVAATGAPADCKAMRTVVYAVGEPHDVLRGRAAAAMPSDCVER